MLVADRARWMAAAEGTTSELLLRERSSALAAVFVPGGLVVERWWTRLGETSREEKGELADEGEAEPCSERSLARRGGRGAAAAAAVGGGGAAAAVAAAAAAAAESGGGMAAKSREEAAVGVGVVEVSVEVSVSVSVSAAVDEEPGGSAVSGAPVREWKASCVCGSGCVCGCGWVMVILQKGDQAGWHAAEGALGVLQRLGVGGRDSSEAREMAGTTARSG